MMPYIAQWGEIFSVGALPLFSRIVYSVFTYYFFSAKYTNTYKEGSKMEETLHTDL